MRQPLTPAQKRVYDVVKNFIAQHGYSPTIEEATKILGLKAISTVHEHMDNLRKLGYVKREMNQPRSLIILEDDISIQKVQINELLKTFNLITRERYKIRDGIYKILGWDNE